MFSRTILRPSSVGRRRDRKMNGLKSSLKFSVFLSLTIGLSWITTTGAFASEESPGIFPGSPLVLAPVDYSSSSSGASYPLSLLSLSGESCNHFRKKTVFAVFPWKQSGLRGNYSSWERSNYCDRVLCLVLSPRIIESS